MPFKSKAQMRFMYANHPKIAERWAEHTPNRHTLPERKGKTNYSKEAVNMAVEMSRG